MYVTMHVKCTLEWDHGFRRVRALSKFSTCVRVRVRSSYGSPGKRSRLEIHHLARATYTSNTLQVSQLTPSQTFHFVVQRARHGARWFPQVGAFTVRCYSLFLVSKVHGRGDGNRAEVHGHPWILDTEDLRFFFIFNIDNLDRAARYLM